MNPYFIHWAAFLLIVVTTAVASAYLMLRSVRSRPGAVENVFYPNEYNLLMSAALLLTIPLVLWSVMRLTENGIGPFLLLLAAVGLGTSYCYPLRAVDSSRCLFLWISVDTAGLGLHLLLLTILLFLPGTAGMQERMGAIFIGNMCLTLGLTRVIEYFVPPTGDPHQEAARRHEVLAYRLQCLFLFSGPAALFAEAATRHWLSGPEHFSVMLTIPLLIAAVKAFNLRAIRLK